MSIGDDLAKHKYGDDHMFWTDNNKEYSSCYQGR